MEKLQTTPDYVIGKKLIPGYPETYPAHGRACAITVMHVRAEYAGNGGVATQCDEYQYRGVFDQSIVDWNVTHLSHTDQDPLPKNNRSQQTVRSYFAGFSGYVAFHWF